jgi:hypothetical protein
LPCSDGFTTTLDATASVKSTFTQAPPSSVPSGEGAALTSTTSPTTGSTFVVQESVRHHSRHLPSGEYPRAAPAHLWAIRASVGKGVGTGVGCEVGTGVGAGVGGSVGRCVGGAEGREGWKLAVGSAEGKAQRLVGSSTARDPDSTRRPPLTTRRVAVPGDPEALATTTSVARALPSVTTTHTLASEAGGGEISARSASAGCEPVLHFSSRFQPQHRPSVSVQATPEHAWRRIVGFGDGDGVVGCGVGSCVGRTEGGRDDVGWSVGVRHCAASGNTTVPCTRSLLPLEITIRILVVSVALTTILEASALAMLAVTHDDDPSRGGHASTNDPSVGTFALAHVLVADH